MIWPFVGAAALALLLGAEAWLQRRVFTWVLAVRRFTDAMAARPFREVVSWIDWYGWEHTDLLAGHRYHDGRWYYGDLPRDPAGSLDAHSVAWADQSGAQMDEIDELLREVADP